LPSDGLGGRQTESAPQIQENSFLVKRFCQRETDIGVVFFLEVAILSYQHPIPYGGQCSDMKMKIGVLSDTHLHRLTRDFRDILDRFLWDVDLIFHVGDFVSPEIVEFLRRKNFHGVHGNMDPIEVKEALPEKKVVQLGPYRLGLHHGYGPPRGLDERVLAEFPNVDVIVYGHSHRPANYVKTGILLFNPGTATGFSFSRNHSVGILELGETIRGEIIPVE
jgi:putative phosphoesterase